MATLTAHSTPDDNGLATLEESIYVRWRLGVGIPQLAVLTNRAVGMIHQDINCGRYMVQRRMGWK